MSEVFYLNGALVPREQARISVLDYGFLCGYGLYETVRAYDGVPFRLDAHLARMRYSADRLGIPVGTDVLRQAVMDTVKANGFADTRVRICLSAGEGSVTPNLSSCEMPTIAVLVTEYLPPAAEKYAKGYRVIVTDIRRNSRSPVTYMKSLNGIDSMLARQESRAAGADEALLLNDRGYLSEACGSNVFIVKDGVLRTPRFEAGILPGVTRVAVFELAARLGIKVEESDVRLRDLLGADEAFLTNSLIEVVPLTAVGKKAVADGAAGRVTRRLMKAYRQLVVRETRK
jgi:branched-chain amino acid aminotransferase